MAFAGAVLRLVTTMETTPSAIRYTSVVFSVVPGIEMDI